MPQQKPWEKYAQPSGPVFTDPTQPYKAPQAQADLEFKGVSTDNVRDEIRNRTDSLNNTKDNQRIGNTSSMRDNFQKLPEVQRYKIALYNAQRAMGTAANPQGDLALTYAIAQAMDPLGSVREGDQASIAGTQPALSGLVERIKKNFGMDGAGAYTPEARKALRREVFNIIASYKPQYDARRADAADFAKSEGINPTEVIGRDDTSIYAPAFRKYGEMNGDDGTISRIVGGEPIKGAITAPQAPPADSAGFGATKASKPIPPAMQQEYATYLNQNWGKLNPSDFSAFRINLDRKYGFGSNPDGYRSDAEKINGIAQKGGTPQAIGPLTPPDRNLSAFEQLRNDAVSNKYGTAAATTMNGIGFGLPSLFAGDQFSAIRKDHPGAALVGDIAGGIGGSMLGGGALKLGANALERGGAEGVAKLLANPLTADVGYGTVFGGNDAAGRGDNWLMGGATGALGGVIGNKVGGAIGKAFPSSVGVGGAIKKLDATVPTSGDLKTLASGLYGHMEASGLTASPADTFALTDSTKRILADVGEISPKDKLTAADGKISKAYNLINDYGGEPMDPKQYQTVRTVIGDALNSQEPSDKRVAKALLENFDNWTTDTNPAMADTWKNARDVSSRYLQGDALVKAGNKAGVRAGQYTQSGIENGLRVDYRALARKGIEQKGTAFAPHVADQIETVTNGTPLNNTLRALGSLAPVSPSGIRNGVGTMMGASGLGSLSGAGGGTGAVLGGSLIGTSLLARQLSQHLTKRGAKVAENMAYGGPEYAAGLGSLLTRAGATGGDIGTGAMMGGAPYENDIVARMLRARNGAY